MRRTAVLLLTILPFITSLSFSQVSFTQHSYPATGTRLLRADFNNDGRPDLLVYGGSALQVLLDNPDGTFAAPISIPMTGATSFAVALDYNKDGNMDVAACSDVGTTGTVLAIYSGDGHGHLTQTYSASVAGCYGLATADFN